MPKLELFCYNACPYCATVTRTIKKLNLEIIEIDVHNDQKGLERLQRDTGRRTVPCLYIDNVPMFESQDIVNWLEANQDRLKKKRS